MINCQSEPSNNSSDPKFTVFKGAVYKMPILKQINGKFTSISIQEHFGENIYTYENIGEVSFQKINIPETNNELGKFPGVNKKTRFAMVLNAQMVIQNKGCYEFILDSDDGSILWLNNLIIINNDGGHKMRMKKETILLEKGSYDAKLWYFQGMPDRFGFIFDSKYVGTPEHCSNKSIKIKNTPLTKIILSHLNFESSHYKLNQKGLEQLSEISKSIQDRMPTQLTVIGHTDNGGNTQTNQILSTKRAEYIATQLKILLANDNIKIIAVGKGMTEPLKSNHTIEGRASNRRVEIILK